MEVTFKFVPLNGMWPRDKTTDRKRSPFQSTYGSSLNRLKKECGHLAPVGDVIIQADFKESDIRLDGAIRADARQPSFPGVIINITSNRRGVLRFVCDACHSWQHNVHAIALTLERLRLVDLYGVTRDGEQYKGWKALPAPEHQSIDSFDTACNYFASVVTSPTAPVSARDIMNNAELAQSAYRAACKVHHPDAKNNWFNEDTWGKIQAAWARIKDAHKL